MLIAEILSRGAGARLLQSGDYLVEDDISRSSSLIQPEILSNQTGPLLSEFPQNGQGGSLTMSHDRSVPVSVNRH